MRSWLAACPVLFALAAPAGPDVEADVLAFAKLYQDATDFHLRRPPWRPPAAAS